MTWTEATIQNRLAGMFNKSSLCVPNCGVFGWEADLIRVTPRLLCAEYEVKISRSDFRADSKRTGYKKWKRLCYQEAAERVRLGKTLPNYFWYVAPPSVIPLDEVPEFAGLVELVGPGYLDVRKKSPLLHKARLDTRDVLYITRGCALRYWQQRSATTKD